MTELQTRLVSAINNVYKLRTAEAGELDDADSPFRRGFTFLDVCATIYSDWDGFLRKSHRVMVAAGLVDAGAFNKPDFVDSLALPWPVPTGSPMQRLYTRPDLHG